MWFFFFFKQKTAYEIVSGDWSSDVCSSDLRLLPNGLLKRGHFVIDGKIRRPGKLGLDAQLLSRIFQSRRRFLPIRQVGVESDKNVTLVFLMVGRRARHQQSHQKNCGENLAEAAFHAGPPWQKFFWNAD